MVSLPPGTEMFYFPGCAHSCYRTNVPIKIGGFPHSEIFGSKVARHLPEAYRRHAASFIASLEPRHPPYALRFPLGNLITTISLLLHGIHITVVLPVSDTFCRPARTKCRDRMIGRPRKTLATTGTRFFSSFFRSGLSIFWTEKTAF